MAKEITKSGAELLDELLSTKAPPKVKELAEKLVSADRPFDDELERCLRVDPKILRRKITV